MLYLYLKTKKTVVVLAIITLFFCGSSFAQTTATTEPKATGGIVGATTLVDKFFKAYKESSGDAVYGLFETNKNIDSASLKGLIEKMDKERVGFGKYLGKELITQKKASNSLILYSYLVKHEILPVRFTFMFYKPKNDWMIYRFYFDGNVETELQDAAKIDH